MTTVQFEAEMRHGNDYRTGILDARWCWINPDRSSSLIALANVLCDRFEKIGAITDLEEGISMYRESLCISPAPHQNCLLALRKLAGGLETRFKVNGVQSDLDEANSLRREVLVIQPQ
jgi:hypothetical protein